MDQYLIDTAMDPSVPKVTGRAFTFLLFKII